MVTISSISALQILDSRGNPTLEVEVTLSDGTKARASVPSGASTGLHEACELRDGHKHYFGKGVTKAISHIHSKITPALIGKNPLDQKEIDHTMIDLDGTENKHKLGANAILGVSMAVAKAASIHTNLPLYKYLGGANSSTLPIPMINIINGGEHAQNTLDIQEFMIKPHGFSTLSDSLRAAVEIFHTLKKILKTRNLSTAVGDEGGFAPQLHTANEALELIMEAISSAGYRPGKEVSLALDFAASSFYDTKEHVYYEKKKKENKETFKKFSSEAMIDNILTLIGNYPIVSIEDPLDENDWSGWEKLSRMIPPNIQLVGDDIFVTNRKFLNKGIQLNVANAILIKPNQIGTVTETLEVIEIAKRNHYGTVISHRSGETEDTFIADLAVATNAGQIKTGSMSRSERICKYNQLLRIEKELGENGKFKKF